MADRQTTRWISSPVESVFACIRNPTLYAQWVPSVSAVRWPSGRARAVGQVGVLRAGQRELYLRITGYAENRLIELELRWAGRITRERIELEPALGGTRVIHTTVASVLGAPDSPLHGRLPPTQKLLDDLVGALKRALEARN
jgi:hypothetical protein